MKRRLCKILCMALALLLLAGCTAPAAPVQTELTDEPASPAELPATSETPAPTEPAPTEPAATDPPSVQQIITDYSAYTPKPAMEMKFTRLQEDWIPALIPGDYGAIYPFVGGTLYENGSIGYAYHAADYYGFVTADGMIVCDPVYTGVSRLSIWDSWYDKRTPSPLWLIEKTTELHEEHYEDYSWMTGESRYAVAAADGSFITDFKYSNVTGFDGGFIGEISWNPTSFEVCDLEGNVLFTSRAVPWSVSQGGYYSIYYSEGYFTVFGDSADCLLDRSGRVVLGPYPIVRNVCEGLVGVSKDGEHCGYMRPDGTWAIEPKYSTIDNFRYGYAQVRLDNGRTTVVDHEGTEYLSFFDVYLEPFGDAGCLVTDYAGSSEIFSLDGMQLYKNVYAQRWSILSEDLLYAQTYPGIKIFRVSTGETLELPGMEYLTSYYGTLLNYNGQTCYGACSWNYNDDGSYEVNSVLFTPELEILAELDGVDLSTIADDETATLLPCLYRQDSNTVIYQWADGAPAGTFASSVNVRFVGDYMLYANDACSVMINRSGEILFCYPLLSRFED